MWSKTQKQLDDLLCISFKDRVKYFATQYRQSHDQQGAREQGKSIANLCRYILNGYRKQL